LYLLYHDNFEIKKKWRLLARMYALNTHTCIHNKMLNLKIITMTTTTLTMSGNIPRVFLSSVSLIGIITSLSAVVSPNGLHTPI
jgi:hypothetical protein